MCASANSLLNWSRSYDSNTPYIIKTAGRLPLCQIVILCCYQTQNINLLSNHKPEKVFWIPTQAVTTPIERRLIPNRSSIRPWQYSNIWNRNFLTISCLDNWLNQSLFELKLSPKHFKIFQIEGKHYFF